MVTSSTGFQRFTVLIGFLLVIGRFKPAFKAYVCTAPETLYLCVSEGLYLFVPIRNSFLLPSIRYLLWFRVHEWRETFPFPGLRLSWLKDLDERPNTSPFHITTLPPTTHHPQRSTTATQDSITIQQIFRSSRFSVLLRLIFCDLLLCNKAHVCTAPELSISACLKDFIFIVPILNSFLLPSILDLLWS